MTPAWYDVSSLPWSEMVCFCLKLPLTIRKWPEASIYLPALLHSDNSRRLLGRVDYRERQTPCGLWFWWE